MLLKFVICTSLTQALLAITTAEALSEQLQAHIELKTASPMSLGDVNEGSTLCGVSSLYVCAIALEREIPPDRLVSPAYVGSFKGSSVEELVKAAEDSGLHARALCNLTLEDLRRMGKPAMLHVRNSSASPNFNHWIAYLGFDGREIRIVDAPDRLRGLSSAQLLAKWDGVAIVLSTHEFGSHAVIAGSILRMTLWVAVLLVIALSLKRWQLVSDLSCFSPIVALVFLLGLTVGVAAFRHVILEDGFCRNKDALAEVTRRFHTYDLDEISLEELNRISNATSPPLIVDARRALDYRSGTIPQAINMPVDSTLPRRQELLTGIPKSREIVVFCQSERCDYADQISQFLYHNGYTSIRVYRAGYVSWKQREATGL